MKFIILFAAIFVVANAAVVPSGGSDIISNTFTLNHEDGSYGWDYKTADGTSGSENGKGGEFAKGLFEWTSPEGEKISIQYTADENGYQPSGSHVPAVPDYIVRALEWSRAHPYVEKV